MKDDSGNPTHSFKDRVVASPLTAARELGLKVFACPSTGNLANAVAAAAARAGIRSVVFIPHNLERPKIITTAVYGGTLVAVEGNYDDVNKLASEIAGEEEGWAFVNVNVRPYYAEGSKTLAFEIAEQLGWRLPRADRHPGRVRLAADQDRQGLHRAGQARPGRRQAATRSTAPRPPAARRSPRRSATATTWSQPVKPDTIAKSLAIGNPADGPYVLDVARRTGGAIDDVNDEEVVEGIQLLARTEGIFAETAGGVTVATLKKLIADRPARPRGRDGGDQLRRRAEDARRRGRPGRPQGHHPRVVRRLREGRPAVSVSVRVPTILRPYTEGVSEVHAEGATLTEVLDSLDGSYPGIKGRVLDDVGRAAPLRQRVRRRRRRTLRRRPADRRSRTAARSRSSPRSPAADELIRGSGR